jgi:hypothetical protein
MPKLSSETVTLLDGAKRVFKCALLRSSHIAGLLQRMVQSLCSQRWNSIFSFVVVNAQTVRASLFANAVATSIRGLRASILARHDPGGGPFRMAQQMNAIAPVISNRLISICPILRFYQGFVTHR